MTKLPRTSVPHLYGQLMSEIKNRLAATEISLKAIGDPKQQTFGFLHLEFCYLQIRRSIELVAIAVLLAHNEIDDFRTRDFMKDWNAGVLFKRLEGLSNDAFPEPAVIENRQPDGSADLFVGDQAATNRARITEIYAACGDKLHAGSLKGLLRSPKQYRPTEIVEWRNFLVNLLNHHVILLPGRTAIMTVFMASNEEGTVSCNLQDLEPDMLIPRS